MQIAHRPKFLGVGQYYNYVHIAATGAYNYLYGKVFYIQYSRKEG